MRKNTLFIDERNLRRIYEYTVRKLILCDLNKNACIHGTFFFKFPIQNENKKK